MSPLMGSGVETASRHPGPKGNVSLLIPLTCLTLVILLATAFSTIKQTERKTEVVCSLNRWVEGYMINYLRSSYLSNFRINRLDVSTYMLCCPVGGVSVGRPHQMRALAKRYPYDDLEQLPLGIQARSFVSIHPCLDAVSSALICHAVCSPKFKILSYPLTSSPYRAIPPHCGVCRTSRPLSNLMAMCLCVPVQARACLILLTQYIKCHWNSLWELSKTDCSHKGSVSDGVCEADRGDNGESLNCSLYIVICYNLLTEVGIKSWITYDFLKRLLRWGSRMVPRPPGISYEATLPIGICLINQTVTTVKDVQDRGTKNCFLALEKSRTRLYCSC